MTHTNHKPTYLEALKERVLVFDGAMGTSIDSFNLTAEDFGGARTEGNRDYLVITRPDVIEQIHSSFMEAGCDVLERLRRPKKETGSQVAGQAQIFLALWGRMLLGPEIPAVIATLEAMPVDVIGLNCSTGPEHMRDAIRSLCAPSRLPISCIPNAGLPLEVDGETVYPMEPEPFARILSGFAKEYGVSVVGGCCGTRPAHLAQLRAAIGYDSAPTPREIE